MPRKRRRPKKATIHAAVRRQAHKTGMYERMLDEQGGTCALCPSKPGTRRLHVDHSHKQVDKGLESVRGVLCLRCNTALRYWITSDWCYRAGDYLKKAGE